MAGHRVGGRDGRRADGRAVGLHRVAVQEQGARPGSVYADHRARARGRATEVPADLTLLRPRVRPGLDTSLIAALYPDRRLDHFAAARWSAPLQEVVQDLALQAFRGDAHVQNVHTDISSFGSGYWLEIDVADFQAEYGASGSAAGSAPPTIHVRLAARLGASTGSARARAVRGGRPESAHGEPV